MAKRAKIGSKTGRAGHTTRVSATKLSKATAEILDRVALKGEQFVVERHGKTVCRIVPAERKRCSGAKLARALERFGPFGDELAAGVKEGRAALRTPRPPSW